MKCRFRFLFILLPIVFISLGALITLGLWNWLIPSLFGLGTITFLQAAGILVLARILFGWKGFHHHSLHGHMQYAHANSCHPRSHYMKSWMHPRWQDLTDEQKEKMANRCGYPGTEKQEAK